MDIVTHGLLGALTAQSVSTGNKLRAASLVGGVAALLPDVDVMIRNADDVLLALTYHRHFTHSLLFVPLGALIASVLVWPLVHRHLRNSSIYVYACVGYLSACLLDVCTSYGTQLLWPFSSSPLALSIVAVVDPVFSALVLMTGLLCWYQRKKIWAIAGLLLAISYLLLAFFLQHQALNAAEDLADQRGLAPERLIIKPTLGNIVLWRAIQVDDGVAYTDAIRVSLFGSTQIYPGEQIKLIDPQQWRNLPAQSRAYSDLQRYYQLADRLLVEHPHHPNFIGDLRYAMLPHSVTPMWGITLLPDEPEKSAGFIVERQLSSEERRTLMDMLKGK